MRFRKVTLDDARDYLITGFILLTALVLMIARNADGLKLIRSASLSLYSYLEEPLSGFRVYRQALMTNEQLQKKNILLQDELNRLRSVQAENQAYKSLLQFKDTTKFSLVPVQIIGKNFIGINNSITIDAGKDKGIQEGMALVTSNGLAGRVILTSKSYSLVMPLSSSLFRASAKVQGSRAFGLVQWDGNDLNELTMYYVPNTIPVDSGTVVETSGYSLEFPPFIPIGTVISAQKETGKATQVLSIRPLVSLNQIAEGFIITNQIDTSLQALIMKADQ